MIGDHIRARKGGRWTHAIDCGDETVLFLRDDAGIPPADRIARSYRPEFVAGADTVEVVTHRERVYPPRQVVARAYSRTRDAALAAMFRDSEAFAEWCKSGRLLSAGYNYAVSVPGAKSVPARTASAPRAKAKLAAKPRAAAKARVTARAKVTAKAKPAPRPAAKVKAGAARPAAGKLKGKARPAAKAPARGARQVARKPAARKPVKGKRR